MGMCHKNLSVHKSFEPSIYAGEFKIEHEIVVIIIIMLRMT